jgi:hypothetical protein
VSRNRLCGTTAKPSNFHPRLSIGADAPQRVSDCAGFGGPQGGVQQKVDALRHGGEALVVGQALMVAVINLLDDDGDFEASKY